MLEEAKRRRKSKQRYYYRRTTSGNTGIAVAILASVLGLKAVIIVPEKYECGASYVSAKAYGAQLILTPKELGIKKDQSIKQQKFVKNMIMLFL